VTKRCYSNGKPKEDYSWIPLTFKLFYKYRYINVLVSSSKSKLRNKRFSRNLITLTGILSLSFPLLYSPNIMKLNVHIAFTYIWAYWEVSQMLHSTIVFIGLINVIIQGLSQVEEKNVISCILEPCAKRVPSD
jgi:hypothetical protein